MPVASKKLRSDRAQLEQQSESVRSSLEQFPVSETPEPMIEATGWAMNENGAIELVAGFQVQPWGNHRQQCRSL